LDTKAEYHNKVIYILLTQLSLFLCTTPATATATTTATATATATPWWYSSAQALPFLFCRCLLSARLRSEAGEV